MSTIKVSVDYELKDRDIANLICCGLEAGSTASFGYSGFHGTTKAKAWRGEGWEKFFGHINPALTKGAYVVLYERHHDKQKWHRLDLEAIERGLEIMARDYPRHFSDFRSENEDAITGDVFLQCALLGEVVYG